MSDLGGKGDFGCTGQEKSVQCNSLSRIISFCYYIRCASSTILGEVVFLDCCSNRIVMVRGITETGLVDGEKAFHRSTWVQERVHEG